MRSDKDGPYILFFFLGGLFVLVGVIGGDAANYGGANNATEDGGIDWVRWLDLIAQWVMAIGTLFVFTWTVKALRHSERTAKNALDETKRSVDAYVEAERGRFYVIGLRMGPSDKYRVCDYTLQNIGNGPVSLDRLNTTHITFPIDGEEPHPGFPKNMLVMNYPLRGGEYFTTYDHGEMKRAQCEGFDNDVAEEDAAKLTAGTHGLLVQFDIAYQTLGKRYLFRDTWVIRFDGDKKGMTPALGNNRRYDRRVKTDPTTGRAFHVSERDQAQAQAAKSGNGRSTEV